LKRGAASDEHVASAIDVMTSLNAGAADAAQEIGVHAATDITGFGLLGHLREMCVASGVAAVIDAATVPVIPGVRDLIARGMVAGGTARNHAFVAPEVDFGDHPEAEQLLLADAQTSGGLLLAVPPSRTEALVTALRRNATLAAAAIGHVTGASTGQARLSIR
jgi:selenide,water dikinase